MIIQIDALFISNAWLKLANNQVNAKQNPEPKLLLFENYSHSSPTLSCKNNSTYSKKKAKEQVDLYPWDYTINHNENEDKNKDMDTNIVNKIERPSMTICICFK